MAFPQTRHTLIERLADGGADADWREFLRDYWGPVCRFARQRGNLKAEDAEDVASETLEAIVKNNLLARWSTNRSARLRTLICAVVRKVLANRIRVATGRDRAVRENADQLERYLDVSGLDPEDASQESSDAFYAAWAEDILQQTVEGLLTEYNQAGKGDCFRVLYGRLCEDMPMSEIAVALRLTPGAAESHYRQAKQRLAERLQELVRWQVGRYSSSDGAEAEFIAEWGRLGEYLRAHGGLETAVRRSYGDAAATP
ncbi:MAG TPA: sigma-70 family RNA polymerase sigma factor [Planctomycetaceae bacterium]|nr:sigma-70 family RNA polymerase sigma factor [Planctomycetaceae bacterium]